MSATRELTIQVGLDRTKQQAQAEQMRAEMAQLNQRMIQDAIVAGLKEVEANKQRLDQERKERLYYATFVRDLEQRRAAESRGLTGETYRSLKRHVTEATTDQKALGEAASDAGQKGKVSFADMAIGVTAFVAGARLALGAVREMGAEMDRVGQRSRELAGRFVSDRDKLREAAAVEGRQPDNAFALEVHRSARDAAMSFDEAAGFRTAFANETAAYKGRTISDGEYEQYRSMTAQQASRMNVSGTTASLFAGSFLTRDLRGYKDRAAEEAFRRQYQVAQVFDVGQGSAEQNYGTFGALKKQFEPGTGGSPFKSDVELATVASIANAGGADRSRESVEALVRGLRDTSNKDLPALYAEAGLPAGLKGASLMDAVRKLAPVLQRRQQKSGLGLEQVIAEFLPDIREQRALAFQVQQGVIGGQYEQRAGVAARAALPGAGEAALAQFMGTDAAQSRVAAADAAMAQAERGSGGADLDTLRRQALAGLTRAGAIDTNATGLNDWLNHKAGFGLMGGSETKRIDDEVLRMLRARAAGGKLNEAWGDMLNISPEARERELNRHIGDLRGAGVNPFAAAAGEETMTDRRDGLLIKEEGNAGPFGMPLPSVLYDLNALLTERRNPQKKRPQPSAFNASMGGDPYAPAPASASGGKAEILLQQIARNTAPAAPRPPAPMVAAPTGPDLSR